MRVEQMVLDLAAADPSPARGAARRKAARVDGHGAPARQRDVEAAADGDVAAGGDEAVPRDQLQRGVDGHRLDDAVQVEQHAAWTVEEAAVQTQPLPASRRRRARSRRIVRQERAVAVVPRGLDGCAEGWIDAAGRGRGSPEGDARHAPEERRHDHDLVGMAIDAAELAAGPEAAERLLPLLEQVAGSRRLDGGCAADANAHAHGVELRSVTKHGCRWPESRTTA